MSESTIASTTDESPTLSPRPVQEPERIVALDVLRGVALLGILAMNIRSFAAPFAAYFNPLAIHDYSGAPRAAYWVTTLLFDTKMISIFSMLFGAGALIYGRKEAAGGVAAKRLWYRRNFWLLVIGLVHAYLIWEGDILVVYSLCALFFLWWTRSLSAWALVLLAAVMFGIGALLTIAHAIYFDSQPADLQAEELAFWQPTPDQLADEVSIFRGGYLRILAHRAPSAFAVQTFYFLFFLLWRAGGMMVLGQAFMKWGVLTGARSNGFYLTLALVGYAVGIPLVCFGLLQLEAVAFSVPQRIMLDLYNYFGSISVALGHVGLVLWLLRVWPTSPWFDRLAAVGRMALTNYLAQSIICTTLFYGYGFSLFGRLDYAWQLVVVAAIWAVQMIISPWWLRRYQNGPVEWLWRWLTYRRRPPMKRDDHTSRSGLLPATNRNPG